MSVADVGFILNVSRRSAVFSMIARLWIGCIFLCKWQITKPQLGTRATASQMRDRNRGESFHDHCALNAELPRRVKLGP